jgi:hypothetical protein
MNDLARTPDDCRGKDEDHEKRQDNCEDKRDWPRHLGLDSLLERPDQRYAEKRKRDRLKHDPSQVKGSRYKNHGEEDLNEATEFGAVRGCFLMAHFFAL